MFPDGMPDPASVVPASVLPPLEPKAGPAPVEILSFDVGGEGGAGENAASAAADAASAAADAAAAAASAAAGSSSTDPTTGEQSPKKISLPRVFVS